MKYATVKLPVVPSLLQAGSGSAGSEATCQVIVAQHYEFRGLFAANVDKNIPFPLR